MDYFDPVIFDLETTGPDPNECKIIQIAALAPLSNDKFEVKLEFDPSKAEPEALEKNSFDLDVWDKEAVDPKTALEMFGQFLRDHTSQQRVSARGSMFRLALGMGYNILRFDMVLIHRYFHDYQMFLSMDYRTFDVMQLALWHLSGLESYSLVNVAKHLQCYRKGAHDALTDVEITADVAATLLAYDDEHNNDPLKWVRRRLRMIKRRRGK